MANILHVRQADWPTLENSEKPVLVDFWAEWCGPCRALAPTFEKLAENYQDNYIFAKVNVDEVPELAERLGIRSIPTLVLLNKGQTVERVVGLRSYDELARVLEQKVAIPSEE